MKYVLQFPESYPMLQMSFQRYTRRGKRKNQNYIQIYFCLNLGGEGATLLDGGGRVDVALEVQTESMGVQQVF